MSRMTRAIGHAACRIEHGAIGPGGRRRDSEAGRRDWRLRLRQGRRHSRIGETTGGLYTERSSRVQAVPGFIVMERVKGSFSLHLL